ncbi:hypothetical protein AB0442_08285 [Kitasatospora sp. NPDC085895]|uniref:hypothetical protein n=1 Tax=Kitasatospora sp. NPDC085895 TaxID=3155057 RepID=UPI00344B5B28
MSPMVSWSASYRAGQPPATCCAWAMPLRVSPSWTTTVAESPGAVAVSGSATAALWPVAG